MMTPWGSQHVAVMFSYVFMDIGLQGMSGKQGDWFEEIRLIEDMFTHT